MTTPDLAALSATLDELERLHAAADPGPWKLSGGGVLKSRDNSLIGEMYYHYARAACSMQLIPKMHAALPELIRLARLGLAAEAAE